MKKKNYTLQEAFEELDTINESNEESFKDDFDKRWEEKFGDPDQVLIMSAEDTLAQLKEMRNFK